MEGKGTRRMRMIWIVEIVVRHDCEGVMEVIMNRAELMWMPVETVPW